MKQIFILFILFIISITVQAQSFMVTDLRFSWNVDQKEINRERKRTLGSEIKIQEFDNVLKVVLIDNDGSESKPIFLEKKSFNEYRYEDEIGVMNLTIEWFLGYYRAINIAITNNETNQWYKIKAKRK